MQKVRLFEILSKNLEEAEIEPTKIYTQITVRLWGKGVCKRDEIKGNEIKSGKRFAVKENQFIISKIDARHGAYGLIPKELNGGIATSEFPTYNLDEHRIIPEYFQWVFSQKEFIDECKKASSGTTNRIRLNQSKFLELEIPVPSITQQREILEELSIAKSVIKDIKDYNSNNQELIQNLIQAVLQDALFGKLIPQDQNDEPASELLKKIKPKHLVMKESQSCKRINQDSFNLPNNWTLASLEGVGKVTMGQSPQGCTYNSAGEGIPLINGPVEFSEGSFGITIKSKWTTAPTKLCKKGDILICVRGSTTGRTNIAGFDACIGRGVASIQPYINQKYVHYFLLYSKEKIFNLGSGTTFPNITLDELVNLIIPIPPLKEQDRIVAKVDSMLEFCHELEEQTKFNLQHCDLLMEAILKRELNKG